MKTCRPREPFRHIPKFVALQDAQFPYEPLFVSYNMLDCQASHISQTIAIINILQTTHTPTYGTLSGHK